MTTALEGLPSSANESRARRADAASSQRPGLAAALAVTLCTAAAGAMVAAAWGGVHLSRWHTPRPDPPVHLRLAALPAGPMLDAARASHGRDVFATVCAVCHSPTGMGRYGLGKDLVHSDFVADSSDAALLAFVIKGRDLNDPANTMKVAMPPRGGNMTLTDEDLGGAIEYLRGLQDPRRLPVLAAPVALSAAPPTEAEKAEALAAAGGDAELAQYIASGKKLFASTCVACHGSDAKGLPNLGKDLTVSPFVAESDDDTLLAMLKRGRAPGEPGNTTGIAMPPKGGNPALSEDDLLDIIEFLRSIHTAKKTGS